MAKEVIKDPQIFIAKEARVLFDNMKNNFDEFKQFDNKDFFILAMIFGYANNKRKPLKKQEKEKSGFTRQRYLTNTDEGILKAIAIDDKKDISAINDIQTIYSIAEEYTNGGITYLKEFIYDNPASLTKKFSAKLNECLK